MCRANQEIVCEPNLPGVLWRQEEDTKLMDAYGGELKLTQMWVARH